MVNSIKCSLSNANQELQELSQKNIKSYKNIKSDKLN